MKTPGNGLRQHHASPHHEFAQTELSTMAALPVSLSLQWSTNSTICGCPASCCSTPTSSITSTGAVVSFGHFHCAKCPLPSTSPTSYCAIKLAYCAIKGYRSRPTADCRLERTTVDWRQEHTTEPDGELAGGLRWACVEGKTQPNSHFVHGLT